jgi:hypothetical protein
VASRKTAVTMSGVRMAVGKNVPDSRGEEQSPRKRDLFLLLLCHPERRSKDPCNANLDSAASRSSPWASSLGPIRTAHRANSLMRHRCCEANRDPSTPQTDSLRANRSTTLRMTGRRTRTARSNVRRSAPAQSRPRTASHPRKASACGRDNTTGCRCRRSRGSCRA